MAKLDIQSLPAHKLMVFPGPIFQGTEKNKNEYNKNIIFGETLKYAVTVSIFHKAKFRTLLDIKLPVKQMKKCRTKVQ